MAGKARSSSCDDHTQLLIGASIKECQSVMNPSIAKAQVTAEKAHKRIDDLSDRVFIMDNPETGKVSVLWDDRKAVANYIRNGIITIIGVIILSQVLGYFLPTAANKEVVKQVVQELYKEGK